MAGYMRAGGTPSERLLVGGEMQWVMGADAYGSDVPVGRSAFLLTLLEYPGRSGFFGKAGIGYTPNFAKDEFTMAFNAGIGADLRVGSNFFVTPNLDLMLLGTGTRSISHPLFTVGVTWH